MKGAVMKLGQMVGFVADGLPPAAQEALAQLQQDVPPMAPSLAEQVVTEELGDHPDVPSSSTGIRCRSPPRRSARSTGR